MKTRFCSLNYLWMLCTSLALACCSPEKQNEPPAQGDTEPVKAVPFISYTKIKKHPHDTTAFTEGLLFDEGRLLESTGDIDALPQTRSVISIVDLATGKTQMKVELDKKTYFGEGIVVFKNKIYQLTYQNQVGFIYDSKTFTRTGQFSYPNKEGWGMTTDGKNIIMSDGTFNLTFLDPVELKAAKTLPVTENGYGLDHLNELEYIKGYIYANVWMTTYIVKIDPGSGEVVAKIDLSDLYTEAKSEKPNCLETNGIAYDPTNDKIYVTGKLWPSIYEISFPH